AIQPGGAVQRTARTLDQLKVLVRSYVLAPLEEHMLKEVCEPGPARALVGRTHVVPEIDGDDRRRVIFREHHAQAVGEAVCRDGNLQGVCAHLDYQSMRSASGAFTVSPRKYAGWRRSRCPRSSVRVGES